MEAEAKSRQVGPVNAMNAVNPAELGMPEPVQASAIVRLLHDRLFQVLLIAAAVLNVALIAFVVVKFDALPDPLPLHFDASGLPDRIDSKTGIVALPAIGFIILVADMLLGSVVYRHERAAALLLVSTALIVQVLMWFAAAHIAGGLF